MNSASGKKYQDSLQTEVDAAFLYGRIAAAEEVPAIARLFQELGEIEKEHAGKMQQRLRQEGHEVPLPSPSWRARVLDRLGKFLGYGYVIGVLMDTEKSIAVAQLSAKEKSKIPPSGDEVNHVLLAETRLGQRC
jgi:vacuolar iron transporter family protein